MKKYLIIWAVAASLMACDKGEQPSKNTNESKNCVVSIVPICEVSTSEVPMTKAESSSNDIYAIQVYKSNKVPNEPFAFGLFDNTQEIKLNLKQGDPYRIQICMVKEAKILLGDNYSFTNGGVRGEGSALKVNFFTSYIKPNIFYYNSNKYLYYYVNPQETETETHSGKIDDRYRLYDIVYGYLNGEYCPSCVDWFYGEVTNYTPNGNYISMTFPLKRTGCKLKYEITGITDGKVTITIKSGVGNIPSRTFFENTITDSNYTSETIFFPFYRTDSAWEYADDYSESVKVAVTWVRGTGITQDLGTKTIQLKRNCLNNIRIKLSSDNRGSDINLTTESESSIGSEESNITLQP